MQQQLGKVLGSSYDEDGFLGVQIQVFGSKSVGWFELSNPHGFQTRPLDPDADGTACQAYYWVDGSRGYATLANDPRTQTLLPQSQKGETFFHGPTGAFMRFKGDGSISLFTTDDNTTNGRSVALVVSPTGLVFNFPYGRLTFDSTGFHVLHNSGARIDAGAVGGLPAPLDALQSYVSMGAAMARVEGSAVSVGPRTGAAQPSAGATVTLALFNALNGVLAALATPGAIIAPSGGGPCTFGPALGAAISTAAIAIGGAATTLPSLSLAVV